MCGTGNSSGRVTGVVNGNVTQRAEVGSGRPCWDFLHDTYPKNREEDVRYHRDFSGIYANGDSASKVSATRVSIALTGDPIARYRLNSDNIVGADAHGGELRVNKIIKNVEVLKNWLEGFLGERTERYYYQDIQGSASLTFQRKQEYSRGGWKTSPHPDREWERNTASGMQKGTVVRVTDKKDIHTSIWKYVSKRPGILIAISKRYEGERLVDIPERHLAALWDGQSLIGGYNLSDWLGLFGQCAEIYFWELKSIWESIQTSDVAVAMCGHALEIMKSGVKFTDGKLQMDMDLNAEYYRIIVRCNVCPTNGRYDEYKIFKKGDGTFNVAPINNPAQVVATVTGTFIDVAEAHYQVMAARRMSTGLLRTSKAIKSKGIVLQVVAGSVEAVIAVGDGRGDVAALKVGITVGGVLIGTLVGVKGVALATIVSVATAIVLGTIDKAITNHLDANYYPVCIKPGTTYTVN